MGKSRIKICRRKISITLLTLALFLLGLQQFSTVADQIQNELSNGMVTLTQVAIQIDPALLADRARLQSVLESHAMHIGLFNGGLRIASAKGKTISTVPFSPERIGADYSVRDYMVAALKEGKALIEKPVIRRVLRASVIGLAVPIRSRDGTIIVALVGAINLGETSFF